MLFQQRPCGPKLAINRNVRCGRVKPAECVVEQFGNKWNSLWDWLATLATGNWQVQDSNDFEDSPQVVPTPEPAGFQLSLVAAREGYAWGAAFTDYLEAWKVDLGVGFVVDVKVDVSGISGLLSLAFISFLCLGTKYIYIYIHIL